MYSRVTTSWSAERVLRVWGSARVLRWMVLLDYREQSVHATESTLQEDEGERRVLDAGGGVRGQAAVFGLPIIPRWPKTRRPLSLRLLPHLFFHAERALLLALALCLRSARDPSRGRCLDIRELTFWVGACKSQRHRSFKPQTTASARITLHTARTPSMSPSSLYAPFLRLLNRT